jgi:hypothetical protein
MVPKTQQAKLVPMEANASRIVESTDEDETLVIAFVPVDAVRRRRHHDHDCHEQPAAGRAPWHPAS